MIRKSIQLGLIHLAVAMTLVPINSTLNRVMIKELSIAATIVAVMASLPYLISPIQVVIGSFSDRHPILGFYRTPYILIGLILCVAGVIVSPQIAFVMVDRFWLGFLIGILAFGAWGIGYNLAAVSYLSLATELSGKNKGRTISVMWVMMILGIIFTAITLSRLVDPYSESALQNAFTLIGILALVLGLAGLIALETRAGDRDPKQQDRLSWMTMIRAIWNNNQARNFFWYLTILLAALLGQDILLEPFAAEAFQMTVMETTRITSIWGVFVMLALILTGWLESKLPKYKIAAWGGWGAFIGFLLITLSGFVYNLTWFYVGIFFLGVGTGVSTVSNLSLMLDMTRTGQVGLFIGAWGMSNAISRLIGSFFGGIGRDLVSFLTGDPVLGYILVFGIMSIFMLISLALLRKINVLEFQYSADQYSVIERSAMAGDA